MTYSYIQPRERKLYVIHVYDYQENQVEITEGRRNTSSSRRWKKKRFKRVVFVKEQVRSYLNLPKTSTQFFTTESIDSWT